LLNRKNSFIKGYSEASQTSLAVTNFAASPLFLAKQSLSLQGGGTGRQKLSVFFPFVNFRLKIVIASKV